MISLIERGESSPTAVVLEKLATGLDVPLASLFDAPAPGRRPRGPPGRPAARGAIPHSGYVRRNVSPGGVASPIQIVEVTFPPGARVAYETGARDVRVHQQVWVLDGRSTSRVGEERHRLRRRLPGHRARPAHRVPQPHAQDRALCRGDRRRARRGDDMASSRHRSAGIRRLAAVSDAQLQQLAEVLIDCVEGGASVSFMQPLTAEGAGVLAPRRRGRGARRARAAGRRGRARHRRHGAARPRPAREPAAPRRPVQDAGAPPRAAPGLGAALMRAAEETARECGKTLLVLDTAERRRRAALRAAGLAALGVDPRLRAVAPRRAVRDHRLLSRARRSKVACTSPPPCSAHCCTPAGTRR